MDKVYKSDIPAMVKKLRQLKAEITRIESKTGLDQPAHQAAAVTARAALRSWRAEEPRPSSPHFSVERAAVWFTIQIVGDAGSRRHKTNSRSRLGNDKQTPTRRKQYCRGRQWHVAAGRPLFPIGHCSSGQTQRIVANRRSTTAERCSDLECPQRSRQISATTSDKSASLNFDEYLKVIERGSTRDVEVNRIVTCANRGHGPRANGWARRTSRY